MKNRRCWNGFCSRALGAAALRPERRDIVGGWYSSFTTFTVCILGFLSRVSFPLPFTGQLWDLEVEVGWWGMEGEESLDLSLSPGRHFLAAIPQLETRFLNL